MPKDRDAMKYKNIRNYENANRYMFEGVGKYRIPELRSVQYEPCEFIGFNYAKNCVFPEEKGIHFFLDDYQFIRIWNKPDNYVSMLQKFKCTLSPDFSLYADFPQALQIYNHYRKHWIGAYLQMKGIKVIPTICWSDSNSFEWCFDGEPVKSCVAISSVGCMMNQKCKERFLTGYKEMVNRLQPIQIIFYGDVPEECEGNIIGIKTFQEKLRGIIKK